MQLLTSSLDVPRPSSGGSVGRVLAVSALVALALPTATACSARSTPRPRPPSTHASLLRPSVAFQTYACPAAYAAYYCLNGATCFTLKITDSILYNCE